MVGLASTIVSDSGPSATAFGMASTAVSDSGASATAFENPDSGPQTAAFESRLLLPAISDRRAESREPIGGNLWLIDNHNARMIRCRCQDSSPGGMHLRVPAGYGVRVGRHYELSSHLPGQSAPPGCSLILSRRATVVRADVVPDSDEIDVGVTLESRRRVAWSA